MPQFDATKPLTRLRSFAAALGWQGLEMWQHTILDWDGFVATWYLTTDRKFFLQINEHPQRQIETYSAAVYGYRYGVYSGFHCFVLYADERIEDEIDRLYGWLSRRQFKDRKWRHKFKSHHPECFSGRKGCPPWRPDDPKPALWGGGRS